MNVASQSTKSAFSGALRQSKPYSTQLFTPQPEASSLVISHRHRPPSHRFVKPRNQHSHCTNATMERTAAGTRSKRKRSNLSNHERPTKQLKPEAAALINGDSTPNDDTEMSIDGEEDEGRLVTLAAAAADSAEWQATIEKVVKNVVSIHFCQTFSFDTDGACSSEATGFVVDAEKGYIMTNRHVVSAGPFWGYCIFDNHEEVRAQVRYCNFADTSSAMCSLSTAILFTTLASCASTQRRSNTCRLRLYS